MILVTNATMTEPTKCSDGSLTNGFGIAVQFLLALLAFSCLIVKRFCEPKEQRRSWLIWFFDTSKQGFGAAANHFVNIWLSKSHKQDDVCAWYVLNFLLDSTVGLLLIYLALKLVNLISTCTGFKSIKHGDYGEPARFSRWAIQCIVYCFLMLSVKGIVAAVMRIPIWNPVSKAIMAPIQSVELEVVLVMFVIPLTVNALIFWVVDNFLMNFAKNRLPTFRNKTTKYSKLLTEDSGDETKTDTNNTYTVHVD